MVRIAVLIILLSYNLMAYDVIGSYFGANDDEIIKPVQIEFEKNNIVILDNVLGKIVVLDRNSNLIENIDGFDQPVFFKKIRNNYLVVQGNKNNIVSYNLDKKTKKTIGKTGIREKEFVKPGKIYEVKNEIWVLDEGNFRIQIFDYSFNYIREILLPRYNLVYYPYYTNNYTLLIKDDIIYLLDSYKKSIYKLKENKFVLYKELKRSINPIDFFVYSNRIYVYDNHDFSIIPLDYDDYNDEKIYLLQEVNYDVFNYSNINIENRKIYFVNSAKVVEFDIENSKAEDFIKLNKIKKGQYYHPIDVKKDKTGNIYILDKKMGKILVYDKEGNFLEEINNIGKDLTGFDIDEFGSIYIADAEEKVVKKYNYKREFVYSTKKVISTEEIAFEEENSKEKKGFLKLIDDISNIDHKKNYFFDVAVDDEGYIYILNSYKKNVEVYDSFFNLIGVKGKKLGLLNVVNGKNKEFLFGWDESQKDTLTDILIKDKNIYVLDNYFNKIVIFGEKENKEFLLGDIGENINSIFVNEDDIFITDTDNYRVIRLDDQFKLSGELKLLKHGLRPMKIYDNIIICSKYNENYQMEYLVIVNKEPFDDRSQESRDSDSE